MDEERARILKLLEEGKITAGEAEKLLLALKSQPRPDMSREELRMKMRKFGLREMRHVHIPEAVDEAVAGAMRGMEDSLNAAVRKQRFEFDSRGKLLVRNVSGDTVVDGWDKPTVLFDREEGGLWRANEREGMIMAKVLSGDLKVRAPRNTSLSANSVSGDVMTRGVYGPVELRTVSGDVTVRGAGRNVDIGTTSGDIKTRDISGKCHIVTVSGDIDLGFRAELAGLVETRSGNVQVWVPSDANLLLEVEIVVDGDIENGVTAAGEVVEERPDHLKLGFGTRANHLWIRCRNGDVSVNSYEPSVGQGRPAEAPPAAPAQPAPVEPVEPVEPVAPVEPVDEPDELSPDAPASKEEA